MSVGVAILGGGIFAREEHLPAVQDAKTLTLKAIYSRSLKSAQSLATDGAHVDLYSDDSGSGKSLDDLLARSDIHAVIIALPIKNQPAFVRKALLAGKHVLSEKPVAENVQEAKELIKWYNSEIKPKKVFWSVAENFRFLNSFNYAAEQRQKMGKTLSFRLVLNTMEKGSKYYETEWRKVPTHQGGFLLDGGVHFTAGLRLLLGPDSPLVSLTCYSSQIQEHLPPVDTVNAAGKVKNGNTGTLSISFGTTIKGGEWTVGCEKGAVSVSGGKVTVGEETKEIKDEKSGVPPEVRAWGDAIVAGKVDERQIPEEALADLEIIEAMLRSGEQNGAPIQLECQVW